MTLTVLPSNQAASQQLRSPRWTLSQGLSWLCDKGNGYGVVEPINISFTGLCVRAPWQVALNQQWMVRICAPDGAWLFCPAQVVHVQAQAANQTLVGLRLKPIHPAQQVQLEQYAQQWIAVLCRAERHDLANQASLAAAPQPIEQIAGQVQVPAAAPDEKPSPAPAMPGAVWRSPRPVTLPAAQVTLNKRMPVTEGEVFTAQRGEETVEVCLLQHVCQGALLLTSAALEVGSCWFAQLALANPALPPVVWPLRVVSCQQTGDSGNTMYRLECRFATIAMAQVLGMGSNLAAVPSSH